MSDRRQAVITGVTGAIGASTARACVAAGFELHAVVRDPAAVEGVGTVPAAWHIADLADAASVEKLCRELPARLPRLSLLVHAAGAFEPGAIDEVSPEHFQRLFQVNVGAPYALTRALLPALRAAAGDVVFVNSSAGVSARPGVAAYAATKHALRAVADGLRAEQNERGIRVLSVYPGRTAGSLQERLHGLEGRRYEPALLLQPDDVAQTILGAVALPRTAEVTDIHIRPRAKPPA